MLFEKDAIDGRCIRLFFSHLIPQFDDVMVDNFVKHVGYVVDESHRAEKKGHVLILKSNQ